MSIGDLPLFAIRAFAFVFGALWGSFFNVAIHRWPREMSVVSPPSHCPACGAPIRPRDNVPILGFFLLRGRARCCGAPLSPRYPVVETLAALLCLALTERAIAQLGASPESASLAAASLEVVLAFAFVGGLLVATFVDLEWMEIPDEVSVGGTAFALATLSVRHDVTPADAALGAGAGYLFIQLGPVFAWERLTGRPGMGEGDAKFLMFIGAFLGWQGALFALVAGAFQGTIVGVAMMATGRRAAAGTEEDNPAEAERVGGRAEPALSDPSASGGDPTPESALETVDGMRATLSPDRNILTVRDPHERLVFEWRSEEEARLALRTLPFGPFLALGALEFLFFGPQLVEAYLALFLPD